MALLDAGEVVGVDPVAPEGRVLQVLRRRVAEHAADVVADEGRRKIAGRLEAVDHRRRRTQQPRQTLLRRSLHLLQLPTGSAFALACGVPYGLLDDGGRALGIEIVRRDVQDVMQGRRGVLGVFVRCRHRLYPDTRSSHLSC